MRTFIFFLVASVLAGCAKDGMQNTLLPTIGEAHKALVEASNNFGFELYKAIIDEEEEGENIVISPLSISTAISMVLNGAVGETETAIQDALQLKEKNTTINNQNYRDLLDYLPFVDKSVTTRIANSIWYEEKFEVDSSFLDVNKKYFEAVVKALNFADPISKTIINNWVAEATNNKIKEIIDEITPDHVMFLINAIYFNANWTDKFDKKLTKKMPFYLQEGGQTEVDMMYSAEGKFGYYSNSNIEMVNLPYGKKNYHYTVIIPKNSYSLSQLAKDLNTLDWKNWISNLDYSHGYHLEIPKYELEYKIELRKALDLLGMGIAFSPGFADFSGISNAAELYISDVNHKTYIKVDEVGTEAAGVTSIGVSVTSMPPVITVDRPFLIVIHEEKTGALLFMGRIMNPNG